MGRNPQLLIAETVGKNAQGSGRQPAISAWPLNVNLRYDMEFDRTGIILYTIKYQKCVAFYEKLIGLTKMFETENLTCFEFGNSYLMVELDDEHDGTRNESERIKTCLRMNIQNVKKLADKLTEKNVEVDYQEHSWGTVAKFFDSDGNLCAFKDSEKFEKQISDFKGD